MARNMYTIHSVTSLSSGLCVGFFLSSGLVTGTYHLVCLLAFTHHLVCLLTSTYHYFYSGTVKMQVFVWKFLCTICKYFTVFGLDACHRLILGCGVLFVLFRSLIFFCALYLV